MYISVIQALLFFGTVSLSWANFCPLTETQGDSVSYLYTKFCQAYKLIETRTRHRENQVSAEALGKKNNQIHTEHINCYVFGMLHGPQLQAVVPPLLIS